MPRGEGTKPETASSRDNRLRASDEERDQTARPRVQPQKNARAWKGESKATRPAESTIAGTASSSHRTRASEPQASPRDDIRSDKRTMRKGTKAELADTSHAATNTATGSIEGRGVVQDSEGIMTVLPSCLQQLQPTILHRVGAMVTNVLHNQQLVQR